MILTLNKLVFIFTYFLWANCPISACQALRLLQGYYPDLNKTISTNTIISYKNHDVNNLIGLIKPITKNTAFTVDKEYDLKASFIYRFTEYIEWTNTTSENFTIGVLGNSLITQPLFKIAKEKKIKEKKINIIQYKNLAEINFCNILFIPKDCPIPIETILSQFAGKPILIIAEHEGFAKKGVHFNFVLVENKLKFEANANAINNSKIVISSFLLQHAIIVE